MAEKCMDPLPVIIGTMAERVQLPEGAEGETTVVVTKDQLGAVRALLSALVTYVEVQLKKCGRTI